MATVGPYFVCFKPSVDQRVERDKHIYSSRPQSLSRRLTSRGEHRQWTKFGELCWFSLFIRPGWVSHTCPNHVKHRAWWVFFILKSLFFSELLIYCWRWDFVGCSLKEVHNFYCSRRVLGWPGQFTKKFTIFITSGEWWVCTQTNRSFSCAGRKLLKKMLLYGPTCFLLTVFYGSAPGPSK